jgi:hypothetical protein
MSSQESLNTIVRRHDGFMDRVRGSDINSVAEEFARVCHSLKQTDLKLPLRALSVFAETWIDLFWQCRRHDLMLKVAEEAQMIFGPDPE